MGSQVSVKTNDKEQQLKKASKMSYRSLDWLLFSCYLTF